MTNQFDKPPAELEELKITVEVIKPEDWANLKKIRLESLKEDPDAFGGVFEEEEKKPDQYWKDLLANQKENFYVLAKRGREPIGITGARRTDPKDYWWVFGVYVSGKARGKGVSREIMKKVEEVVKKEGGTKLGLDMREGSEQIPAFGLYIDQGYRLIQRRESQRVKGRIIYNMKKI